MKKHLLWRDAIFAACSVIFFFVSCNQTEFDGRIDTVYTLDTPSVTAKAYPGVNIVSWNPVTGAGGYKISVYEEGFCIKSDIGTYDNHYIDSNLLNGKKYTYYVEAVSVTNPGTFAEKGVYAKNSRGEASATAIVPPANTKSLELPAYEDGYDGTNTKYVSENDQWIVNEKNTTINNVNGKVTVNFPMKAYLEYEVTCYNSKGNSSDTETVRNIHSNNAIAHIAFDTYENINYYIEIEASSLNKKYVANVIIKQNNTPSTSDQYISEPYIYASYTNQSSMLDNSVQIRINKVTNENSEYISRDWYQVYRMDEYEGTYDYSFYSSSFYEEEYGYYYLDDTVPDVTHKYRYFVTITNGSVQREASTTLYGKTGNLNNYIDVSVYQNTGNSIEWNVTLYGDAQYADLNAYYLVTDEYFDYTSPEAASKIKNEGNSSAISYYDLIEKRFTTDYSIDQDKIYYCYVLVEADLYPYEPVNIVNYTEITSSY